MTDRRPCPVCTHVIRLTKDGRVMSHDRTGRRCGGSGVMMQESDLATPASGKTFIDGYDDGHRDAMGSPTPITPLVIDSYRRAAEQGEAWCCDRETALALFDRLLAAEAVVTAARRAVRSGLKGCEKDELAAALEARGEP